METRLSPVRAGIFNHRTSFANKIAPHAPLARSTASIDTRDQGAKRARNAV